MPTLIAALLLAASTIYGQHYSVAVTGPERAYAGDTVYLRLQAKSEKPTHLYLSVVPSSGNGPCSFRADRLRDA